MSDIQKPRDAIDHITYEVTIKRDAKSESLALASMAHTFGWNVRERNTLKCDLEKETPASWIVSNQHLEDTSSEIWGSNIYGKNAVWMLDFGRGRFDHFYWEHYHRFWDEEDNAHTFTSIEEAKAQALREWFNGHFPYEMHFELRDEGDLKKLYAVEARVTAGEVTRDRLADHLRHKRLHMHTLHGSIGKTIDTMNIVCGLRTPSDIGNTHAETDFISYSDLSRKARSELTTTQVSRLYHRLSTGISKQIFTGRPAEEGEIIIEGKFFKRERGAIKYEQVAASSLVKLADYFEDNSTRTFLRSFA